MRILVLNAGSSSVKYRLLQVGADGWSSTGGTPEVRGTIERVGSELSHAEAFARVLAQLPPGGVGAVFSTQLLAAFDGLALQLLDHGGALTFGGLLGLWGGCLLYNRFTPA